METGRDRRRQAGASSGVRVHVRCDREAGSLGRLDGVEGGIHLGPVRPACRLEVVHLGGQSGAVGDREELVEGLEEPVPLAAKVRDVFAAVPGGDGAQLDQLLGRGEAAWRVDEGRADAEGAVGHLVGDEALHVAHLGGRHGPVLEAGADLAQRPGPYEGGDVLARAPLLDVSQVLGEGRPRHIELERTLVGEQLGPDLGGQRPHGEGLAEDLCRHALGQLAQRPRVLEDRDVRVAEHVHEAGRHRHPAGIELNADLGLRVHVAHHDDEVLHDTDVGQPRRPSAAVVDGPVADDEVERHGLRDAIRLCRVESGIARVAYYRHALGRRGRVV